MRRRLHIMQGPIYTLCGRVHGVNRVGGTYAFFNSQKNICLLCKRVWRKRKRMGKL